MRQKKIEIILFFLSGIVMGICATVNFSNGDSKSANLCTVIAIISLYLSISDYKRYKKENK